MTAFATTRLPAEPVGVAPDGTDVRPLLALAGGSFAHFTLAAGAVSGAVAHRTVEEIWFVTGGSGEMWRSQGGTAEVVLLEPGICLTIPLGTQFQFRANGADPLTMLVVTMPPWPGGEEAVAVPGHWPSTAVPG